MSSLSRATLAEQAYRELQARILSGRLPGGQRLLPEELALALSISPTPIKEALLRLEADGLVVSMLRRGVTVRRFSRADVRELYEARVLIELHAVSAAFARDAVRPELINELRHSVEQHELYAERDTLDDLRTALTHDRRFHQQITAAGGNTLISDWHLRILSQTHTVFVFKAGNYLQSVHEHREVLDALEDGDCLRAQAALERHLLRSRENTLQHAHDLPAELAGG